MKDMKTAVKTGQKMAVFRHSSLIVAYLPMADFRHCSRLFRENFAGMPPEGGNQRENHGYGYLPRRASSASTASRMNVATRCSPTRALIRSIASAGSRTVVAFTPRGGLPIRGPLSGIAFCGNACIISATAY